MEEPPSILLVDDDEGILEEMVDSLSNAGFCCQSACSGREALRTLRSLPSILVVVTDLRMPHMDGFALIQAIRDIIPTDRQPRIVFVSAHLDTEAALTAIRSDAVDFLPKPFSRQELLGAIRRASAEARVERTRKGAVDSVEAVVAVLKDQVQQVARHLQSFRPETSCALDADASPEQGDGSETLLSDREMAHRLNTLTRWREERQRVFPPDLFSDPGWDMLLDLTHNRLSGHSTYVSSLAVGAQVPLTTTLRYLETLSSHELVRRFQDPSDKRRMLVELTTRGFSLMRQYLAAAAPSDPA